MTDYVSLYDYLGRAAGSDLGKAVAVAAKEKNIKVNTRFVKNSKYTGNVLLYPKAFLQEYFNTTSLERKISETQDNTLPF